MDKSFASALILRHEDRRNVVYLDSLGNPTAGVGHMDKSLTVGDKVSDEQIEAWFATDLMAVFDELARLPWVNALNGVRQAVMADMAFNMGTPNLCGFRNMISYLQSHEYPHAGYEMVNGKWLDQVKFRAYEDSLIVVSGQFPGWYTPTN